MRDFGVLKGSDLVQVLATVLQEGLLRTERVQMLRAVNQELGTHSELYFQQDHCIHASTSDHSYQLGELLYQKRLLERTEVEALQKKQQQSPGRSLTQILLENGQISATELARVIAHLLELISYEILLWKATAFSLEPSRLEPDRFLGTGLPAQNLMPVHFFVADADKNLPVLVLMREQLGNLRMVPRRQQELAREQLSDYQYHVYRYINNRHSVRELLQLSELGYFDTFAALFQLISWGYVAAGQLETPRYSRSQPAAKAVQAADVQTPARPQKLVAEQQASLQTAAEEALDIARIQMQPSGQRQFLRRGRGSDLLQVLVAVIKSGYTAGRLVIDNQRQVIRAEMTLFERKLVHAATTANQIRFGEILVKRGVIGPGQLREALEDQKTQPDVHLGTLLARHGLLAEAAIPALVQLQISYVLYEVLAWPDVKFYFVPQPEQPPLQKDIRIEAQFDVRDGRLMAEAGSEQLFLLQEADKNLPILLMIREQLPDLQVILTVNTERAAALSDEQQRVLAYVDGSTPVQDILLVSELGYFETLTALFQLLSMGTLLPLRRETARAEITSRPRPVLSSSLKARMTSTPHRPLPAPPDALPQAGLPPAAAENVTEAVSAALPMPDPAFVGQLEAVLGAENLARLSEVPARAYPALREAFAALLALAIDRKS
ncbi:MAG: hypothetical protein IGS03_15445 [Candidatus Sericytochromatia bacterium]|nr:hypothetical protein [Candidatus Sericytochromatia bacterium]